MSMKLTILEYGVPSWLPHQAGHIASLEKVQKRLARACIPAPRGELSYETRLSKLGLVSLNHRFTFLVISFVSKCLHGVYDVDPFRYISVNTRHVDTLKFSHNYARTNCFKYTVFNRFPVYFGQLPVSLQDQLLFSLPRFLKNTSDHFKSLSWIS